MAVVLEHGSGPLQSAAMYSFIHSAPNANDHKGSDTFQHEPQTYNLDGANDRSLDNPFTRSRTDRSNINMKSDGSSQVQPKSSQYDTHFDVDASSTRRKRRKISDGSGGPLDQELERSVVTDANSLAHSNQPHALPGGVDIRPEHVNNSPDTPSSITPKHVKKRTPRKTRNQQSDTIYKEDADLQLQDIDNQTFPAEQMKTTLSLHSNGKLLSSPVNNLPPQAKTLVTNNHKTTPSVNYKMRNGKFVQSLEVALKYGHNDVTRNDIGRRIDTILSNSKLMTKTGIQGEGSKTHPFFLGKVKPKTQLAERLAANDTTDNDSEATARPSETVPWKDIKFSSIRPVVFKSSESIKPPWPPLQFQHVGIELPHSMHDIIRAQSPKDAKLKTRIVYPSNDEDLLHIFAKQLARSLSSQSLCIPEKMYLSGAQAADRLLADFITPSNHEALSSVRSTLVSGLSAFDRGECAGPNMWPMQYAPSNHSEVLQPQASTLHQWLKNLAIHNVKSGIDTSGHGKKLRGPGRKKRRKIKNELDDFIANSDDDDDTSAKTVKTAILITGPHGCGKTASVFAVAKELGFEVFEIHPGMRRSAKDIFDKVGDMAHNHLVQQGQDVSRSSSVALSDIDANIKAEVTGKQPSVVGLLGSKKTAAATRIDPSTPARTKREQKQSLILFEEVDLLFDDDKGFWTGVQSLIQNSKRPIVLTCNDLSSVPVQDLDLYAILSYTAVEQELATDYLLSIAAAEGHLLDREALTNLYVSKHKDLRASITELNLWCQMTVGSKQGGLDWMGQNLANKASTDQNGRRLRTFSGNTYQKWLDLSPQIDYDNEAAIRHNQDSLGIAASEWCDFTNDISTSFDASVTSIDMLSRYSAITDAQSVLDLLDDISAPRLASATANIVCQPVSATDRNAVADKYMGNFARAYLHRHDLLAALEPVMMEKPAFPPSQGRLAPSIDSATPSVATDIAPYVRCIVRYDKRLEEQREELFGSQGKPRTTRAARAAAEGGDKANTRSERWFPKTLDFDRILRTANHWPEWGMERKDSLSDDGSSTPLPPQEEN